MAEPASFALRIAYLVNQYPQPSQAFIRREVRALEAQGLQIARFTVRTYKSPLVDPADREEQARTASILDQGLLPLLSDTLVAAITSPVRFWRALRLTLRHARRGDRGLIVQLAYLVEASSLRRLLRKAGAHHVHAHFGTNSTEVVVLCHLLGGPPFSFTAHGPEEFDRVIALHLREKVHHSAFAVCISSYGRSQLWRWIDFEDWHKVKVVHCGVDEQFLGNGGPTPVPDSRDLVCVGRLVGQKGQLVLLEAARRLRDAGERFCIHLLGDGPLRGEIERFIAEHRLDAHVRLHGFASNAQVRQQIQMARATVLPSFAEGLPVAIMESLALGRPCITSYVAGIPELVVPGQSGWLVPAGDADALVAAIREALTTSTDRLTEMGTHGSQRVRARHDVAREAARLRAFFEEAVAASRPAPAPAKHSGAVAPAAAARAAVDAPEAGM